MSREPQRDIVEAIMIACKERGLDAGAAVDIEKQIREEFGGLMLRIQKRNKFLTAQERKLIVADGMTAMSTNEITAKHGISRASLYRLMKKGGA